MSVIFRDLRPTTTVELPSYEGSAITMYTKLTVGESRDIAKKYPGADKDGVVAFDAGLEYVLKSIKSWNFTDEEGKDLPVSMEVIEMLPQSDLEMLVSKVTGEGKKKE